MIVMFCTACSYRGHFSSRVLVEKIHKLVIHRRRIRAAGVDRLRRAVPNVVTDQFASDRPKRLLNGRNLPQYIRAVAVPFHHLVDTADLTLDTPESCQVRGLDFRINRDCFAVTLNLAG
jgi:hypothetical protein